MDEIRAMGETLVPELATALGNEFRITLQESTAQIGSGALPTEELPTVVIAIEHPTLGANAIAQRFRAANPPIIGRINDDRFLLDLRTIFDSDELIPKFE
jgi:L-seryl-tRNA(Ser) seleniumtransferase